MRFLTKVDLSGNKLTKLGKITSPALKNLILDTNEIDSCDLSDHATLQYLSLNKNKLASLAGFTNLSSLETLSVCESETLASLQGISNCPKLKKLLLSANTKLEAIDVVPDLPALEEIHLNGCPLTKFEDIEKFKSLKKL